MASPNSLKRAFNDIDLHSPLLHEEDGVQNDKVISTQPETNDTWNRFQLRPSSTESSDVLSTPNSSVFAAEDATILPTHDVSSAKPGSKRKKLTPVEQGVKQIEKEFRDRQKAEEKEAKDRQKAEEKAKLEESRRLRDAEKEEKRKAREAQTKNRDAERQKKEEEKTKKEKSQLRLNAFFVQPPYVPDSRLSHRTQSPTSSRRSSVASADEGSLDIRTRSITASPQKNQQSDYQRIFPPFFLQSHTVVAPHNRFILEKNSMNFSSSKIDEGLDLINGTPKTKDVTFDLQKPLNLPSRSRKGTRKRHFRVREIVERIHGTFQSPIDLTGPESRKVAQKPIEQLKCVSMKYLKFAEDVRPPYIGTYTKNLSPATSKLCKNPFVRSLPFTDYDYDSEAEWEDPGEGEDLDSEAEEELGDDDEGDEMEGFLDDEEAVEGIRGANVKHRPLIGDLEPISTGLCWDVQGIESAPSNFDAPAPLDLGCFKLDIISDHFRLPINPYLTTYWEPDSTKQSEVLPLPASLDPSRMPLKVINGTNDILRKYSMSLDGSSDLVSGANMLAPNLHAKTPKRLVAPELMDSFKAAIQGSDLTKAGLVEVLKKQFPKQSKDAIKDTIGLVAERIGHKEAEKRWLIKAPYSNLTST